MAAPLDQGDALSLTSAREADHPEPLQRLRARGYSADDQLCGLLHLRELALFELPHGQVEIGLDLPGGVPPLRVEKVNVVDGRLTLRHEHRMNALE